MLCNPIACQAPLTLGFFRQEYWSELPFPTPEYLPNSEIEPASLAPLALAGRFFTSSTTCKAQYWSGETVKSTKTVGDFVKN